MASRRKRTPQRSDWLRDRDIIGAWGFRILATALLSVVIFNLRNYTTEIDTLSKEVPVLSNTVAKLTDQMRSEQDQINKIWDRLFDNLTQTHKK